MPLKLVFLGRLEDAAGTAEREIDTVPSIADVLAGLEPALSEVLDGMRVKLAVNGRLVSNRATCTLRDGDEVAFLPPVSGG
jgi:molybdopterin synthase sulfur carrier subunit